MVRTKEDIQAEMDAVKAARLRLVNRFLRLKMFMLRPLTKFVEPVIQFAHYMGQTEMAKWILDTPEAPKGFIDGGCQWCDLPEEDHDEDGWSEEDYESGIAAESRMNE